MKLMWIFVPKTKEQPVHPPIIHGNVNGVGVIAQGDTVAFIASDKKRLVRDDENGSHNLLGAMLKNNTKAMILKPEGIWLFYSTTRNASDSIIHTDPLYPTSADPNLLSESKTPIHILFEQPQPTPTLYTGIPWIEETPALLNVSSSMLEWLAEMVTIVSDYRQASGSSKELTVYPNLSPTAISEGRLSLLSISEEPDELLISLSSTTPMPTPIVLGYQEWKKESGNAVYLETELDILTISPSPTIKHDDHSTATGTFSWQPRQVPDGSETTTHQTSQTAEAEPVAITESPAANHPVSKGYRELAQNEAAKLSPIVGQKRRGTSDEPTNSDSGTPLKLVRHNEDSLMSTLSVEARKSASPDCPDASEKKKAVIQEQCLPILPVPVEVLKKILSYLSVKDLATCKRTCRIIKNCIEENHLDATRFYTEKFQGNLKNNFLKNLANVCGWLEKFDDNGGQVVKQLQEKAGDSRIYEISIFAVARALAQIGGVDIEALLDFQHEGFVDFHDNDKFSYANACFSPNQDYVMTFFYSEMGEGVSKMTLYRLIEGKRQKKKTIHPKGQIKSVHFNCRGDHLVIIRNSPIVFRLHDNGKWKQRGSTIREYCVMDAYITNDGNRVIVTSTMEATIYEFINGNWQKKPFPNNDLIITLAYFSPDEQRMLVCGHLRQNKNSRAIIYDCVDQQWKKEGEFDFSDYLVQAGFSGNGRRFFVVKGRCEASELITYEVVGSQWMATGDIQPLNSPRHICFSNDGHHIFSIHFMEITIIGIDDKKKITYPYFGGHSIMDTDFLSQDGQFAAFVDAANTVQIYRLDHNTKEWSPVDIGHSSSVKRIHFSPDGYFLLTTTIKNSANIYSLEPLTGNWIFMTTLRHPYKERQELYESSFTKNERWLHDARFSSGGHYIVTVASDFTTRVWTLKLIKNTSRQ